MLAANVASREPHDGEHGEPQSSGWRPASTLPARHPQGCVSGAPHRSDVCFPSCCQSLQGWWGERAGAQQIECQTQQKHAHLGLRGTGDKQK